MINYDVMRLMEVQRGLQPLDELSELARSSMPSNYERSIAMMGGAGSNVHAESCARGPASICCAVSLLIGVEF